MTNEPDRIRAVYAEYVTDDGRRGRWDPGNPGNRAMRVERTKVARAMLTAHGLWPTGRATVLEIGCGSGSVLEDFRAADVSDDAVVGVDLLESRVAEAKRATGARVAVADASALPFPDVSFPLVLAYTVFSSILDDDVARRIASEVGRVLRPGGGCLVYDFRYPNPSNANTRRVGDREVSSYFDAHHESRSLTVLPPVARRLGPLTGALYPMLAAIPVLRSHRFTLVLKPRT